MKALLCITAVLMMATFQALAAEKDIADYFGALPPHEFTESAPSYLVKLIRRGALRNSFIDVHNGFMSVERDGAQGALEIALFLYPNRQPLLAVASTDYPEEGFTHLSFFTEREGEMVPVKRAILPVPDAADLRFALPRLGLTLVVWDLDGNVASKWTWNRTRFLED
jgi:hypothetical protein